MGNAAATWEQQGIGKCKFGRAVQRFFGVGYAATAIPTVTLLSACSGEPVDSVTDTWALEDTEGDAVAESRQPAATPASAANHPIVLIHGFFGFDTFAGLDFFSYFYGVRDELAVLGEYEVFTPALDPFNSSEHRAEQLVEHIEAALALTGRDKVNLIGHSQGGLDARVVASLRPDLVASVTTIATPHHGSIVADVVNGLLSHSLAGALVDAMTNLLMGPVYGSFADKSSMMAALEQLTTSHMLAFNAEYRDSEGVEYFSIAGRSGLMLARDECAPDEPTDFIDEWSEVRDPLDPAMWLPGLVLSGQWWSPIPHDGLVRVKDSRWGTFLGCIPADHFDQVGQLLGGPAGLFNEWSHLDFYGDLVDHLRARGL